MREKESARFQVDSHYNTEKKRTQLELNEWVAKGQQQQPQIPFSKVAIILNCIDNN